MRCSAPTLVSALFLLAPAAMAGDVLVVDAAGDGDFTTIQAGVDAAQPGDTVLVRSGGYAGFHVDQGLTVAGEASASVLLVTVAPGAAEFVRVAGLPAGQAVTLRGFEVEAGIQTDFFDGLSFEANAGAITVEDVTVDLGQVFGGLLGPKSAIRVASSASVDLVRVEARASLGGAGLKSVDSSVFAHDSSFRGGVGTLGILTPGVPAGSGVAVDGGLLFLSNASGQGGAGANGLFLGGCADPTDGGAGLALLSASSFVSALDSSFAGGAAGAPTVQCPGTASNGRDVQDDVGSFTTLAGIGRAVSVTSPAREGELWTETYTGGPGDLAFVVISPVQVPGVFVPEVAGAGFLGFPNFLFFKGVVPGSGELELSLLLAELGPGLEAVSLYYQPVFVEAVGGTVVLGAPSAQTLLDAAIL